MKTLIYFLCKFALTLLVCTLPLSARQRTNPIGDWPPENLMFVFEIPSETSTKEERDALWIKQKREILEFPDLTNQLYKIFWHYVDLGRNDVFEGSLHAFGIRKDLTLEQQQAITTRLKEKATLEISETDNYDKYFVDSAIWMLGSYPSPEHEELLLSLLKIEHYYWKRAIASSLGKIGTRKSLEPLRELVKIRRSTLTDKLLKSELGLKYGMTERVNDPVESGLDKLERRLAAADRKSLRNSQHDSNDYDSLRRATHQKVSKIQFIRNNPLMIAMISILVLGTGFWFYRKRCA